MDRKSIFRTNISMQLIVSFIFFFAYSISNAADEEIVCKEGDVCRQSATQLPLRALPRDSSKIFTEASEESKVIASNVNAFWPVYVFERKDIDLSDPTDPKGWYRVGPSVSDPMGWMMARDVFEWKQALVVSYTHPGTGEDRRNPVLMYQNLEKLKEIVESDERSEIISEAYKGLEASPPTAPEGVVSSEPRRFVDIEEKFYILPVLRFEATDVFDEEAKFLQIAAAVPRERADEDNPDTLQNEEFAEQATSFETTQGTNAENLGVDIKFIMDVTGSMGPYIDRTKDAILRVTTKVEENLKIDTRASYGLVAFSDNFKNLTPSLVDAEEFKKIISGVRASGGGDYQEEVFAGVREGIQSGWNENTLRIMVVVGDASSHPMGHPMNLTGMDEEELRIQADQNNITVFSIHLKAAGAKPDHPVAEKQFRTLARNPGGEAETYLAVDARNVDEFEKAVKTAAGILTAAVGDIRGGKAAVDDKTVEEFTEEDSKASVETAGLVKKAVDAALVRYLGSAAKPPRDITAWMLDRDLENPDIRSLDVRVLVKKRDLNDLIQALDQVMKAVKRAKLTEQKFFDALQGVVASGTKGEKIDFKRAGDLAASGLMPSWIESLPYRSAILNINNETFESLSADERAKLEMDVDSKLSLYRDINENTDLWIALDDRDAKIDHVYPLSLDALP